jgi:hypothetical protein
MTTTTTNPGIKKVIVASPDGNGSGMIKRDSVEALAGLSPRQSKKLRLGELTGSYDEEHRFLLMLFHSLTYVYHHHYD